MDTLEIEVSAWAALIDGDGGVEPFGAVEGAEIIPAQLRRRLPAFSRDVARCALPLLRADPGSDVVFASRDGDLASTVTLLSDLARRELLSPALFSLSVHNAPAGVLSLCLGACGDHTAIAAGEATLNAALLEAHLRLQDAPSVLVVYADQRLPDIYADLAEDSPGIVLAMRLNLAPTSAAPAIAVKAERSAAVDIVGALHSGHRVLRFTPAAFQAAAA